MLHFQPESLNTILCLGAHSDDIEIGCGGALLRLLRQYPQISVHWVVFSATPERRDEALASAGDFLRQAVAPVIRVEDFRDGFFPYDGAAIKERFEQIKASVSPDLIFTHSRHDLHQDHRLLCELTWNTFRNHAILEYEIPKYDGDLAAPNFFIHLDESDCRRKVELLTKHFTTQSNKDWFTADTFVALMRLRGLESRSATRYAEGFYSRKLTM
jgi:LmbE family N-acetylglucosaminyl deacetylase